MVLCVFISIGYSELNTLTGVSSTQYPINII